MAANYLGTYVEGMVSRDYVGCCGNIRKLMEWILSLRKFALAIIVVQHVPIQLLSAETFDERHAREIAANPSDLQFRLSIPMLRAIFILGNGSQSRLSSHAVRVTSTGSSEPLTTGAADYRPRNSC